MSRRTLLAVAVIFLSSLAGSLTDVVGTSGLLAARGRSALLGLWTFDALLALLAAGAIINMVDRLDRARLVVRLLWTYCAATCGFGILLYTFQRSAWPLLIAAVGERTLNIAMNATVWAYVRDLHGTNAWALSRMRFVCSLGVVSGASAAGVAGATKFPSYALFLIVSVAFLVAALCASLMNLAASAPTSAGGKPLLAPSLPPRQPTFQSIHPSMPPMAGAPMPKARGLRRALGHLAESRGVRLIASLEVLNGVAFTVLAYELARLAQADDSGAVQARYGALRTFEFVAHASGEVLLAPLALRYFGFSRLFSVTPLVLLATLGVLLAAPSLGAAMVGSAALQFAFSFESLAIGTAVAAGPKNARGRVGVLLDGTPYQIGYIAATVTLGALLLAESLGISHASSNMAGLSIGFAASLLAGTLVLRLVHKHRSDSTV